MLPYQSNIHFSPTISRDDAAFVDRMGIALEACRDDAGRTSPVYDFLRPVTAQEIRDVTVLADAIARDRDDVLIFGAGAAGLCGRALCSACGDVHRRPRVHFVENIDPVSLDNLLGALNPKRTAFLAISRSGETIETLALYNIGWDWIGHAANQSHVLCANPQGTLARKARSHQVQIHGFERAVSGRFGIFSPVGLLPAALNGIDLNSLVQGAAEVLAPLSEKSMGIGGDGGGDGCDYPPLVGAVLAIGLHQDHGVHIYGLMPYRDRLADFARWIRQLWAESLGKDGKGMTPALLAGSVDHHSQLQLWIDGPRDRMMTLFHSRDREGELLADIMGSQSNLAAAALSQSGCVTRMIAFDEPSPRVIGALAAHFLIETWLAAILLGVEPFNEPAVRMSKSDGVARFPSLYHVG